MRKSKVAAHGIGPLPIKRPHNSQYINPKDPSFGDFAPSGECFYAGVQLRVKNVGIQMRGTGQRAEDFEDPSSPRRLFLQIRGPFEKASYLIRALLFGVHVRVPDGWKFPSKSSSSRLRIGSYVMSRFLQWLKPEAYRHILRPTWPSNHLRS